MYSGCLRAGSTKLPVCFFHTLLSLSQAPNAMRRRYSTQAVLALPPLEAKVQAAPGTSSKSSTAGKRCTKPDADSDATAEGGTQKAAERTPQTRKALKETQAAERRRKALATLDKTTKFVAAGLIESNEPTLEDLDRLKPAGFPLITLEFVYPDPSRLHSRPPTASILERYHTLFQGLVETLNSKFRRKQLLRLYKEGLQKRSSVLGKPRPLGSLKTTRDVAGEIIRWLWDWPYGTEVEGRMAYLTKRSERDFLISTSEFFLLLGPDGSSLRALTESYGIVVKRVRRTDDAFTLVVEGLSYMLDRLALVLTEQKKRIISETIRVECLDKLSDTPPLEEASPMLPDLIQRISKLANALVEDMGNGMFQISAHHSQNVIIAERLVTRTFQQSRLPYPPLLAHLPTLEDSASGSILPHNYALFPFQLSDVETLPLCWTPTSMLARTSYFNTTCPPKRTMSTPAVSQPSLGAPYLYRARKVSDWLTQKPLRAMGYRGGLREGLGRLIDSMGQPHTLQKALGLPQLEPSKTQKYEQAKITASIGHIVFAPTASLAKTLLPPLRGSWTFPKFFNWVKDDTGRMTFIPEPPNPLVETSMLSRTVLNRLVYRSPRSVTPASDEKVTATTASASTTLKFEMSLPPPVLVRKIQDLTAVSDQDLQSRYDDNDSVSTMRSMYDEYDVVSRKHPSPESGPISIHSSEAGPTPSAMSLPRETSKALSKDPVRLWKGVETLVNVLLPDRPMDMQLSSFESTPISFGSMPPELRDYALSLTHRPIPPLYVTYEGTQYVLDTNATIQSASYTVIGDSATEVHVTIENMVDLESNQHSNACFVLCSEPSSSQAWSKFLGDCDHLTYLRANEEIHI